MRKLLPLALFVVAASFLGCSKAPEAQESNANLPSSTPGTSAGSTADTPGGTPSPGQSAGASGTGTTSGM